MLVNGELRGVELTELPDGKCGERRERGNHGREGEREYKENNRKGRVLHEMRVRIWNGWVRETVLI